MVRRFAPSPGALTPVLQPTTPKRFSALNALLPSIAASDPAPLGGAVPVEIGERSPSALGFSYPESGTSGSPSPLPTEAGRSSHVHFDREPLSENERDGKPPSALPDAPGDQITCLTPSQGQALRHSDGALAVTNYASEGVASSQQSPSALDAFRRSTADRSLKSPSTAVGSRRSWSTSSPHRTARDSAAAASGVRSRTAGALRSAIGPMHWKRTSTAQIAAAVQPNSSSSSRYAVTSVGKGHDDEKPSLVSARSTSPTGRFATTIDPSTGIGNFSSSGLRVFPDTLMLSGVAALSLSFNGISAIPKVSAPPNNSITLS